MPMYNLIEYSDNYQDSSATLYQYKRDEPPEDDAVADLTNDNSRSFKYKVSLLGNPVVADNIARRSVKVVAPLKYLSNFFRSLEMPLINTKFTELESKTKDADIIARSAVTKANSIKSDLNDYVKKDDVVNDITTIKNDYVTNASLTSRLNDLKGQHIATEVKIIDDKTKKNASDVLGFERRLKQKEDIVDEVQRENALTSGRDYYLDKMYLLYECKAFSFKYTSGKINLWKSTGVNNYSRDSDMDAVSVATTSLPPLIDNGRMSVRLEAAYFKQMRLLGPNNDNIVNIYIVYLIDPISNSRILIIQYKMRYLVV